MPDVDATPRFLTCAVLCGLAAAVAFATVRTAPLAATEVGDEASATSPRGQGGPAVAHAAAHQNADDQNTREQDALDAGAHATDEREARATGADVEPSSEPANAPASATAPVPAGDDGVEAESEPSAAVAVDRERYRWLDDGNGAFDGEALEPLSAMFSPPDGYTRVPPADDFAEWLRGVPVYAERADVRTHDGDVIQAPAAAVIAMDVGERNLQQCADTAIRLHAEYLLATEREGEIAYHYTSGDRVAWEDWVDGERMVVSGGEVERRRGSRRARSRASFRRYLDNIFMYAGTRSLRLDGEPLEDGDLVRPGDVFVQGGSPGHAVVVLDVAENAAGERLALLGQGFMPAQELHVLLSSRDEVVEGVWFPLPSSDDESLQTPSWRTPFSRADALRFVGR